MKFTQANTYHTSEYGIIVLLYYFDVKIIRIEKSAGSRLVFEFDANEANEVLKKYYMQELQVEAYRFIQCMISIKKIISKQE